MSRPPKNYPHTRARFSTQLINTEPRVRITISQIVVKMGHGPLPISFPNLSQTCCEPTKTFSLETWRVYLRVKIFFRGGKFSSRHKKLNFFSREENFLTATKKKHFCVSRSENSEKNKNVFFKQNRFKFCSE